MFPLGNAFQVGGQWTLSNTKGAAFELTSSVNTSTGSRYETQDDISSAVFRFASDNTGMVMGHMNLPYKVVL